MVKMARSFGSQITVNLATRRLTYFEGGHTVNNYPVGVGKASTPTPTGSYIIVVKIVHPGGMLGTRWLGLSIPTGNYGIHGTNNPSSIGGYVSNGCIRMYNRDVEELFTRAQINMPVEIIPGTGVLKPESAPSNPQVGKRTHVVQVGDSLWAIARKYSVDLNQIIQVNNITNPNVIFPGQTIIIPG